MADPGDAVYPTVAQLRAVGTLCQSAGLVTVDGGAPDYDDPDRIYPLVTSAAQAYTITEASAKEQSTDPQDLTVEQRVPPINRTTCDADADRDFVGIDVFRRNGTVIGYPIPGLYGPQDALDHTDWTGSGSVGSADAAGDFVVSGAGTLTLTLACNYDVRLGQVAGGTAPEGPPDIYWTRRADHYYATEGVKESPYCWLGFERLKIPITAPGADMLTLTVAYRTYTFTDNHLSDSTRTTDFEFVATDRTAVYTLPVAGGSETLNVTLVAPDGGEYPKFERVVSVQLSGFDNGDWTIGEPTLTDGQVSQLILKTFEGIQTATDDYTPTYGYTHGGASLHHDAAFEWYDADEDNSGHANRAELTVRNFDYIEGAATGLDLTTVYSLTGFCGNMTKCQEVADFAEDTTVTDAATVDDESPPNTLTGLYAFNACYPNADDSTIDDPLEQSAPTAAYTSLRCRTWTIARGIVYCIVFDKVCEGRIHGRTLTGTALLRNTTGATNLYRRHPDDASWTWLESLDADQFGHLTTASLKEAAEFTGDTMVRWLYAVGNFVEALDEVGAVYVREYVHATGEGVGKRYPDLWHGPWDTTYLAFRDSGEKVRLQRSFNAGAGWTPAVAVTPTGWTYPAVMKAIDGGLLVAATNSSGTLTKVWESLDDGASWASLANSFAAQRMDMADGMGPRKYGVLLVGSQQVLRETVGNFSTTLNRSGIGTSNVIMGTGDEARAALLRDPKCNLWAAIATTGGSIKVFTSRENGGNWTSTGTAFANRTDPDLALGPHQKLYLAARSGAKVYWYRGHRGLSSVMDSAMITSTADAERPAVLKLNGRGREALAAITTGGTIRIYGSRDDGRTWTQK